MRRPALLVGMAALGVACDRPQQTPGGLDSGLDVVVVEPPEATLTEDAGLAAGIALSPLTLTPPFSPTIHDYFVECGAGPTTVAVTLTAAPRGTIQLVQPVVTTPASSWSDYVLINPNQAFVVSAQVGTTKTDYWVRCLPSNFPHPVVRTHPAVGTPTPGYYLIGNTSRARGEASFAMVLDVHGVPVWYSGTRTGREPVNVESTLPNTLSFVPYLDFTFATKSGEYEIHDLATNGITYTEPQGQPLDLHDMRTLPNGNFVLISDGIQSGVNLTGLGAFGASEYMVGCNIQEIAPDGVAVWEWKAIDHFDPVQDSTWPQTASVSHRTVVDPFHCNSIDVSTNGDLLVSARHMDSVFLVSRATGAVLWKMGGARYTKDGATYLAVTGDPLTAFYRQHDARLLPNNQISMFDDHTEMPGAARAVVYSYDLSAGVAAFAWQAKGTVSSAAMGSFQIMADGSRIVGWGEGGTPGLAMSEVDGSGHSLMDIVFLDEDQSYRVRKTPLAQLDLALMRNTAGIPGTPTTTVTEVPPPDAGKKDAGARDAGTDATILDATPADSTSSDARGDITVAAAGCYMVGGTAGASRCEYSNGTATAAPCLQDAGLTTGSCPSQGLYGCCVQMEPADAANAGLTATCYYSAADAIAASSECSFMASQGQPFAWQTYAP